MENDTILKRKPIWQITGYIAQVDETWILVREFESTEEQQLKNGWTQIVVIPKYIRAQHEKTKQTFDVKNLKEGMYVTINCENSIQMYKNTINSNFYFRSYYENPKV